MQFIKHRVNSISDLKTVQTHWGVEIDLRSRVNESQALHLSHDPWAQGDDFDAWLAEFVRLGIRGPIILNTKEDGLEAAILNLVERKYGLNNFFFLDTALPTLVQWAIGRQESRFAVRYSAFEPAEFCQHFAGKARWLWVDCFDCQPVSAVALAQLKTHFNICLVSPELQKGSTSEIPRFLPLYEVADAICTKAPDSWLQ